MHKLLVLIILFLFLNFNLLAQESSLVDQWKEALLYGIDNKIIEILGDMQEAENDNLASEVSALLTSPNLDVQIAAIKYYLHFENELAVPQLREDLLYYQDLNTKYVVELLNALKVFEIEITDEEHEIIFEMVDEPQKEVQAAAIQALAVLGDPEENSVFLVDYYEKPGTPSDIKNLILLSLGKLKDPSAESILIDIVDDDGEDSTLRIAAISALGNLASDGGFSVLRRNLSDQSPLIRAAIVGSMNQFSITQVEDIYRQALRDSFWRVRLQALKTIAELEMDILAPAVRYMSGNDPETNIKHQAFRTLGVLGGIDSWVYMEEQVKKPTVSDELKQTILATLIENNFSGSKPVIEEIMVEEWDKENSRLLDTICKTMSTNEVGEAAGNLFERMLHHPNFIIQIYGARGIGKNGLLRYRTTLEQILNESSNETLKLNIQSAIDSF